MKKLLALLIVLLAAAPAAAQSTFVPHGAALKATCTVGEMYFLTVGTAAQIGSYDCTATDTWTKLLNTVTVSSITGGSEGQVIRKGASAAAWSTFTIPDTMGVSTLLYASSANVLAALPTANNGVLITSGAGVPSISSTLPSAVQGNITATGTVASGTWNASFTDAALTAIDAGTWAGATSITTLGTIATGTWNAGFTDAALTAIDAGTWTGATSITTLGTLTTGHWHADVIDSTYGGTGVNNGGRTITVNTSNAAFTFSGAYTLTVPATGTAALLGEANGFTAAQTISGFAGTHLTLSHTVHGAEVSQVFSAEDSGGTARTIKMGLGVAADDAFSITNGTSEWLRLTPSDGTLTLTANIATYGLVGNGTNGLGIAATNAAGDIRFYTGGTTATATLDHHGALTVYGTVTAHDGHLSAAHDSTATAPDQLQIVGHADGNQQLLIGYKTDSDYGSIQAIKQGTAYEGLALNIAGGTVSVSVAPASNIQFYVQGISTTNSYYNLFTEDSAAESQLYMLDSGGGGYRDGWSAMSDLRDKKNVRDLGLGMAVVRKMRPIRYLWVADDSQGDQIGFGAQDIQALVPEAVRPWGMPDAQGVQHLGIDYNKLVPVAFSAIQELDAGLTELEKRVAALEKR